MSDDTAYERGSSLLVVGREPTIEELAGIEVGEDQVAVIFERDILADVGLVEEE